MIYISRESVDERGDLIQPSDEWFAKAAAATADAIANIDRHEILDIYKEDEVRAALEKLFHDKCAYCEWKVTGGSDWDVEHFRPKGRISGLGGSRGYYWLPYAWRNLYPSCTHCNQTRRDKPRWGDPNEIGAAGKGDQFPLLDESTRVSSHECDSKCQDEHTLLIDPCYDDPANDLGFDPTGQVFSLDDNIYGRETIRVLRLARRRLRDLRKVKLRAVCKIVAIITKYTNEGRDDVVRDVNELLRSEADDASEFAATARYVQGNPELFGLT